MSDRIRAYPWHHSELGPWQQWPEALRCCLVNLLESKFPQCLIWGTQQRTLYNDAFADLLGQGAPVVGEAFERLWPHAGPRLAPVVRRAFDGVACHGENHCLPAERNGRREPAWYTFCFSPLRDSLGAVVGVVGTVIETTATVEAERELKGLASRFEREVAERTADRNRLWQLSTDIMLVTRADLTITAVNPAWETVLGLPEAELLGISVLELLHPDDVATCEQAARDLAAGHPLRDMDCRLRHKRGGYRWINWAAVPGGGFFNAVGRDVTVERERAAALEQTEELLRHSQKMEAVGQLTGGLAHDFNNLLTAISGSLELMHRRIEQGRIDQLERYITAARGAADRAAILTHRLLAFARRQTLDARPVAVTALIEGLEELIRQTLGPNIHCERSLGNPSWCVLADANQLESALLNLCINGRDAMPQGGTLKLACSSHMQSSAGRGADDLAPGEYVVISVSDNGHGMAQDVLSRVFDPFFTTKPLGQGTGLGLSMVYGFARQSGGAVRIESTPGQGTRVSIFLPRHTEAIVPVVAESPAEAAEPASGGQCVLLIDDEATIRELVTETLEGLGYGVIGAEDGASGLAALGRAPRVDLLITDIGLPGGLNGRQVAEAIRAIKPSLPVLFITGYAEQGELAPAFLRPGMEILTKPFALNTFARRVAQMLRQPAAG
ncbi:PAS domain-containing sensor histidine kinase [Pseudomonas sp. RIT-PI-S]|uniref:hybrid sensor histidine kinase/response regulator n=1 Tax=Pseudomonas sp. RIT-PI-S TaxID=3035295 RepID=UPI0021DB1783|nr:PAS domain-containing sensor histidine kinase [Pseudomonas sp. RIT-PI-S]